MNVTQEIVDWLAPEHGRTSCDDSNIMNGWGTAAYDGCRCNRCALLQAMRTGEWPEHIKPVLLMENAKADEARELERRLKALKGER